MQVIQEEIEPIHNPGSPVRAPLPAQPESYAAAFAATTTRPARPQDLEPKHNYPAHHLHQPLFLGRFQETASLPAIARGNLAGRPVFTNLASGLCNGIGGGNV